MGIMNERLLFVAFRSDVSEKRAEKTIKAFLNEVNSARNGYPVRFDSIGHQTHSFGTTQAVLGIWYPTEDEADAPISVDEVIRRLGDFARSPSSWRSMSLDFLRPNEQRVKMSWSDYVVYDDTLRARDLYMYAHHLWPAEETSAKA